MIKRTATFAVAMLSLAFVVTVLLVTYKDLEEDAR